ncbi:MAG: septal ring lytic transglycosylase RlpA family protein [Methylococcaceae bacterium]
MNKVLVVLVVIFSSACTTDLTVQDNAPKHIPINVMAVPDAIPRYEKRTRAGNPSVYKVLGKQYRVLAESKGYQQKGIASWYGTKFHGRKTSNGEVYDMYAMTAAHKTLPIPSYVRVTNLKNQQTVVVRVNDRGPFHQNRIIDLSYTAAVKLGIQKTGTGFVEVTALEPKANKMPEHRVYPSVQRKKEAAFYIQTGAFSSQINAWQMQKKLMAGQITNSTIKVAQRQGNELYKVQVGPLYSVNQADLVNEKLADLGLLETQLVIAK